jgi:transcriptional regulator with XRE-family HTH domain
VSKISYFDKQQPLLRFGAWLRQLRTSQQLPLRVVAAAARMDLAHLQKIESGQRLPTDEQATGLARFFRLEAAEMQARRIAERFRQEFENHPAARNAIMILAEEAGVYVTSNKQRERNAPKGR